MLYKYLTNNHTSPSLDANTKLKTNQTSPKVTSKPNGSNLFVTIRKAPIDTSKRQSTSQTAKTYISSPGDSKIPIKSKIENKPSITESNKQKSVFKNTDKKIPSLSNAKNVEKEKHLSTSDEDEDLPNIDE